VAVELCKKVLSREKKVSCFRKKKDPHSVSRGVESSIATQEEKINYRDDTEDNTADSVEMSNTFVRLIPKINGFKKGPSIRAGRGKVEIDKRNRGEVSWSRSRLRIGAVFFHPISATTSTRALRSHRKTICERGSRAVYLAH